MTEESNGTDQEPEEKKVFVDEDWKAQVEAEREELKQKYQQQGAAAEEASPRQGGPLPAPTLDFVASSFAMQAMIAMGVIASPVTGKAEARLDEAKHFIDTIQMLEDKTAGNRTPEETTVFENILHELRMTYVTILQQGESPSS